MKCYFAPITGDNKIMAIWKTLENQSSQNVGVTNIFLFKTYAKINPISESLMFGCFSVLKGGRNVAMFEYTT